VRHLSVHRFEQAFRPEGNKARFCQARPERIKRDSAKQLGRFSSFPTLRRPFCLLLVVRLLQDGVDGVDWLCQ